MPTCDKVSLRVAEVLDTRRRLLDMSQTALAKRLGIHPSLVSRRLDGRSMRTNFIARMEDALDCEIVVSVRPKSARP